MKDQPVDDINVLKLSLHGRLVGYLAGFQGGRYVLSFAEEFLSDFYFAKSREY
ncbi:serine/threonine-protein kinase HipA [Alteromonadaceae bacterium 2753L.S.0a.02]|nr:serine/threonine-protein kinase HipA [Alteromonadaceae bacterium 2753L.S.0a.02]